MNEFISKFVELIINKGLCTKEDFVGCSIDEINEIEEKFQIILPEIYKDFLKAMGKYAGYFMQGFDIFYPEILELRSWSIELLNESETEYKLYNEMFVFSMSQGYEFCCFDTRETDNPKIYQYVEDDNKPEIVWESFSIFLTDKLSKHSF